MPTARASRRNVNGSNNIAIGSQAGYDNLTGNRNVYIANAGADGESGVIRNGEVDIDKVQEIALSVQRIERASNLNTARERGLRKELAELASAEA